MQWYQVVTIILLTIPVAVHGVKHGEYMTGGPYNFWIRLVGSFMWVGILYAGGFWK